MLRLDIGCGCLLDEGSGLNEATGRRGVPVHSNDVGLDVILLGVGSSWDEIYNGFIVGVSILV